MTARARKLRILLVEDDNRRQKEIEGWMPADVHLVWCQNGEAAFGVINRARPGEYAAVMLDNDLDKSPYVVVAKKKTGADVARLMAEKMPRDTPVLVHSMSADREEIMNRLRAEEFPVTQLPYVDLTREKLNAWVDEVREDHEE